jgi:hypothetical protein
MDQHLRWLDGPVSSAPGTRSPSPLLHPLLLTHLLRRLAAGAWRSPVIGAPRRAAALGASRPLASAIRSHDVPVLGLPGARIGPVPVLGCPGRLPQRSSIALLGVCVSVCMFACMSLFFLGVCASFMLAHISSSSLSFFSAWRACSLVCLCVDSMVLAICHLAST